MAESVIRDMRKTLNSEPLFSNQSFVSSERSKLEWKGNLGCCDRIEEVEAEDAQISEVLLNRAKEFAARIRLSLSMFSAKMDRVRTVYEQDSGELDEDELYQVRYNRYIFTKKSMLLRSFWKSSYCSICPVLW